MGASGWARARRPGTARPATCWSCPTAGTPWGGWSRMWCCSPGPSTA